jgi:macrolide-specific efflux system membrane fusion protein
MNAEMTPDAPTHQPRLSKSKFILFALIAAGIILAASLSYVFYFKTQTVITHPRRGPIVEAIYGLATATARNKFSFKVGLTKTVQKVHATEGQMVKKGQALMELSDGMRIFAPFAGTVTSLPYNAGENVFSDSPVVIVEDLSDQYMVANLEQQGAIRVKKGMPVKMSFETIREKIYIGTVKTVFPQKGQFVVHIESKEIPNDILPGMTADVSIVVSTKENALLVPIKAIKSGTIQIRRDGHRQKVNLKIGAMDSEWAEIISDNLNENDEIMMSK